MVMNFEFLLNSSVQGWLRVSLANQGHFFRGGWQGWSKGSEEKQISILYPFIYVQSTFLKTFISEILNIDHGQH